MAAICSGGEDFIEGDLLDFVLDFIDDDTEDDESEDDIEIEELTNEAKYSCDICKKKYKTKTWLVKHIESKHQANSTQTESQLETRLEKEIIYKLLMEAQKDISKDECYSNFIRSTIENYVLINDTNLLFNEIQNLYHSLCRNSDAEKFYSKFYQLIVMKAKRFFDSLDFPMCSLLATRLADKILAYYSNPTEVKTAVKAISEREMDALQYLSGYVIHSLVRKIHKFTNWRSSNSQDLLSLLYAAKSDSISTQRLIASQTRGGLWAVTPECLHVFKLVEEEFRKETNAVHITKVDSNKISGALLQRVDVVSAYDMMTHGYTTSISKETRFGLLDKMIKLFLRVRAFSYAQGY